MNRWQEMVREFHLKFGQEVGADPCIRRPALRARLIDEESIETVMAIHERDIVAAVDGLADLIYVAIGTAVTWGVDLGPIMEAVHASNMAKEGGTTREDGKILKPPGWQPPDIAALLRAQGWDGAMKP